MRSNTFQAVKAQLSQARPLFLPRLNLPFEVLTDASSLGIGAVLQQRDLVSNLPIPVSFSSRKLTTAGSHYTTQEQECLAMVWALKKFRVYLRDRKFAVFTDQQALIQLITLDTL
jgi:ribonuclease HI